LNLPNWWWTGVGPHPSHHRFENECVHDANYPWFLAHMDRPHLYYCEAIPFHCIARTRVCGRRIMQHGQREKRPLTIAISGSSGFIGSAVVAALKEKGYRIKRMVRSKAALASPTDIYWNPDLDHVDANALDDVDVVINLSGKNLSSERWTKA